MSAPWVIVGLPRTGTTLLSFLLALDPRSRALLHWEGESPVPPPSLATAREDPRIAASARRYARLAKLNPAMMAMHPMGATLPQECVALFMYELRTLGLETQGYVPSYGRWLQSCDMRPAYEQHQLALQTLQSDAADRALGAQDAESSLVPRDAPRVLSRRADHLDASRPREGS